MTDRFSIAHSLEARTVPSDNEFVDLARHIPAHLRTSRHDYKWLLRQAVAPLLPAELQAPKRASWIPLGLWLRSRLSELAERHLDPDRLQEEGIFPSRFLPALCGAAPSRSGGLYAADMGGTDVPAVA